MENIIIKFVKEPYGRDKDIQNLFCYIAGECDSKKSIHVIAAEKVYLSHLGRPPDE